MVIQIITDINIRVLMSVIDINTGWNWTGWNWLPKRKSRAIYWKHFWKLLAGLFDKYVNARYLGRWYYNTSCGRQPKFKIHITESHPNFAEFTVVEAAIPQPQLRTMGHLDEFHYDCVNHTFSSICLSIETWYSGSSCWFALNNNALLI